MTKDSKATSVRQRLLNFAKSSGDDYNQVLIRYVGLRFLARLSASEYSNQFILKGATMFLVWNGAMHRPTSDIDLLGYLDPDSKNLEKVIRSICIQQVEDDGVRFKSESVRVENIREETASGGLRCLIEAELGSARLRVQLDVGFGDDVTPSPQTVELPRLLEDEVRRELRAYTPETLVAEKFEAIVKLGLANSRMKDYVDLNLLLLSGEIDTQILPEAIMRTFKRRGTSVPFTCPIGLSEGFWTDMIVQKRWQAFAKRNQLPDESLEKICIRIWQILEPALSVVRNEMM